MKRKMVSFILCIAMCMALAIPAFAVELSPYATDEVGNFSQMIEFAFSDNVEGRFRYSYNDAAGNVVDGILPQTVRIEKCGFLKAPICLAKSGLSQAMQAPPLDWKGYDHERT